MTPKYLLFSASDLQLARDNRDREPIRGALPRLDGQPADALALAQLQALRYVFHDDAAAGRRAIEIVRRQDLSGDDLAGLSAIKRRFGWLSVMSLLRDHPDWRDGACDFRVVAGDARQQLDAAGEVLLRALWLATLVMAAGILLKDEERVASAASTYRRAVDQHIHPEGYFKGIVDVDGASGTYQAQFAATGALVLMSEMAQDLWSYNNRAVSANTAATYTFYYYFFPERWRWEGGLTREITMDIMRREGAYFEMVNRRSPLRGGEELFAEQRPLFSAVAGGLTSLTHGLKPPAKKRWRFF
ncbi:MAG: hypothetical protein F4X02_00800 [Chloroflexi bacterium]|nr:hypothetical protein [Chloroflexota bacterium]